MEDRRNRVGHGQAAIYTETAGAMPGDSGLTRYFGDPSEEGYEQLLAEDVSSTSGTPTLPGAWRFLREAFLPRGYPGSVSRDYVEYQLWDTAQAFCSAITGTLATHATLKGLGVGSNSADAMRYRILPAIIDCTIVH